ncbi:hypothetical protein XENTR_v10015022 [Xenopus tropicalis]|nr:hypothetical protein XENTR_v10015022 [Xenopus tropicalis]
MKICGRFLVLLLCCILAVAYYIFVVEICIFTIESLEEKVAYLIIFHLIYILCSWSFLRTVLARPAKPPAKFCLSDADKQLYLNQKRPEMKQEILIRVAKDLPIYTRNSKGAIRYCEKCQALKPDRCHHCPICNTCVLKLDHHCVFLNNCVGFTNYKYFILSVLYALLLCLFIFAVSLYCSILFWTHRVPDTNSKIPIILQLCVSSVFSLIGFPFYLSHFYMAANNLTTVDDKEDEDEEEKMNPYDLGFSKNLAQVFGNKKKYWFLPIFSSLGDGSSFPMGDAMEDIEKNAGTT